MTADKRQTPRAPTGLRSRGRGFWRRVLGEYELTTSEMMLLEECCRTLDVLDQIREAIEVEGVMVEGSTGQPRSNPALAEARQQRVALGKMLAQLALPDESGETLPSLTTVRARKGAKAANSRWRPHNVAKEAGRGPA